MSAGDKEKAADGGLENSDETEDPSGDRKEEKPELEVEDEKADEGRNEESKDVTESPGAMSSEKEDAAVNLMETESKEEFIKLDNLDTKKSSDLASGESNETEITVSQEENSGSKVEDGKSKNGVDVESQEPTVTQEVKKEEQESFRFAAAVSSIWIPSVVGDQKQKFFLKAGEDKTFPGFSSSNEIFQESQAWSRRQSALPLPSSWHRLASTLRTRSSFTAWTRAPRSSTRPVPMSSSAILTMKMTRGQTVCPVRLTTIWTRTSQTF